MEAIRLKYHRKVGCAGYNCHGVYLLRLRSLRSACRKATIIRRREENEEYR